MRHEPDILPCGAFCIVVSTVNGLEWVERFAEMALGINAPHELSLLIEVVITVRLAAFQEVLIVFLGL